MTQSFVAIMMGSDSDASTMEKTADVLTDLGVAYEMRVLSAHRTPQDTADYVRDAEARGGSVFVCAAGLAAHLAGVVAAHTLKPVIGVPMKGALEGMDSLLSTVQMPGGVPVATVAIGSPGAKNAGYLAAQMLGIADDGVAQRLADDRAAAADKVRSADAELANKHQQ